MVTPTAPRVTGWLKVLGFVENSHCLYAFGCSSVYLYTVEVDRAPHFLSGDMIPQGHPSCKNKTIYEKKPVAEKKKEKNKNLSCQLRRVRNFFFFLKISSIFIKNDP